jgi:hypothetical protein
MSHNLEIWKDVFGYESFYSVSNLGRLYSKYKSKIINGYKDDYGYIVITPPALGGKRQSIGIHSLVARTFLDNNYIQKKLICDHIDENKHNNKLSNLQLLTHSLNHLKSCTVTGKAKTIGLYKLKDYDRKKLWHCRIAINGKTISLGTFENELEATKTYIKKWKELMNENNVKYIENLIFKNII